MEAIDSSQSEYWTTLTLQIYTTQLWCATNGRNSSPHSPTSTLGSEPTPRTCKETPKTQENNFQHLHSSPTENLSEMLKTACWRRTGRDILLPCLLNQSSQRESCTNTGTVRSAGPLQNSSICGEQNARTQSVSLISAPGVSSRGTRESARDKKVRKDLPRR
ncbi:hypothetical protein GBAR_LOCUS19393 [Geodia barretti]|uniref:Uncharacterized protein n=1 Tax=Geodia barretti TaxID=519541 RepID=A0AA35STJ2_GEOBA|nr:hypothetical protein GBAR_LOCUS19393 [Geodia barretti]